MITETIKSKIRSVFCLTICCGLLLLLQTEQVTAQRGSSKQDAKRQTDNRNAARRQVSLVPARLDLLTGEIQTKNHEVEPQGPVILGRIARGAFQPSNYVEFPNLVREPNPAWSPGWIELKTGKIHSDVEAVKPREPFLRGRIAPDKRFYCDSKELEEWAAVFPSLYPDTTLKSPDKAVRYDLQPKIVIQSLPEGWILKSNGGGSINANSPDNQAFFTADFQIDEGIDVLRFAKRTEREILRSFNAYRELSLEAAPVFGKKQGYVRRFQWHDKEIAEDIILIQVYYIENNYEFTATAAARASNFEKLKPQLQRIIDNLTIEY